MVGMLGSGPFMIVYLASDLLWATRIKSTAEALGVGARPVRTLKMLQARLAESAPGTTTHVRGAIFDLEAGPTAVDLLQHLRESAPDVRTIAFAPHVNVEEMERARHAGADRVMTRGAFDRSLPDLLRALDTDPT
ncbi:MAG: hypothetical protein H6811_03875 [Phycisphaeraceae bacterium]|nr:hypothetical protein [Phycisphaeraceae bacterium]